MAFTLTEDQLARTELELGARLPNQYREGMKQSNGGEASINNMEWQFYPIKDTSDLKRLSRTANHIVVETQSCQEYGNFPENALAVAHNGTGDQIVFLRDAGVYGDTVYIWYHETGEFQELHSSFKNIDRL